MLPEPRTISVRFGGGVETKEDPKSVHHAKLLCLENGVFTEGVTIAKRYGYDPLSKLVHGSSSQLPDGRAISGRGDELLLFGDSELFTRLDDADAWAKCCDVESIDLSHRPAAKTTAAQTAADYAELSGIGVYAWEDSRGGVYFSVVDSSTGKTLVRPTALDSNGSRPRVHAVGNALHVYYADATNGFIWVLVVPPLSPLDVATPSPAILLEDVDKSHPAYDVDTDGTKAAIAWAEDSGAIVGLGYVHQSGEMGRPLNGLSSAVYLDATGIVKGPAVCIDPGGSACVAAVWQQYVASAYRIAFRVYSSALVLEHEGTVLGSESACETLACCFQEDNDENNERRVHIYSGKSSWATGFVTRDWASDDALDQENTHSLRLRKFATQYAQISNAEQAGLNVRGDFTFEGWAKVDENADDDQFAILAKYTASGDQVQYGFFIDNSLATDRIYLHVSINGASILNEYIDHNHIDYEWHHYAVTREKATGAIEWYLDGAPIGSDTLGSTSDLFSGSAPFTIGKVDTGHWMDGWLDEVRVWDCVRTPAQILANYNVQIADHANLMGCWRLNNDFADISSNGNDLAGVGGASFDTDVPTFTTTENSSPSSTVIARGVGLASGAFRNANDGERTYVNVGLDSTLYTTYLTMRSDGLVVARCLSGIAGDTPDADHLPNVKVSGSAAVWAGLYKMDLGDGIFAETGIRKIDLEFDTPSMHRTAQLGDTLYLAGGGMLQAYDGDSVVELFHWAIDDIAAPTNGTSGAMTDDTTYYYRFTLEYVLANGEVLRGPVSAGTEVTMAATEDETTWAIPTYRVTEMTSPRGEVRIGVWRTVANGSLYYRVSSLDPSVTGANGYVANDPTSATVAFNDEMSDTDLVEKEPLYTNGGILFNDPTPCGGLVVAGKNRLFFNDPSDPLLVRYSQELAAGYAVETSPRLSVKLDPQGGAITALAVMDDVVYAFKERAIFAFAGPGLGADGASYGFSQPQLIPSAVGCSDARSVAVTPAGILFQSDKGFWLLDRGRKVSYVGAPVEEYASQTVVSADVLDDRHEVRLLTNSGLTLCWDYFFDQWSTFTNHEGLDAAVIDGTYHYLRNDGFVWQETAGEYADDNRQIVLALETAWIKLRDVLQGFQVIWNLELLGEYLSAHTLKVWIQFDYEPGWYAAPWELDPSEYYDAQDYGDGNYGDGLYGGAVGTHGYQYKLHIAEECEAFRLRLEFTEATGVFGACATLSELLVEGGVSGTRKTLQDERSY